MTSTRDLEVLVLLYLGISRSQFSLVISLGGLKALDLLLFCRKLNT